MATPAVHLSRLAAQSRVHQTPLGSGSMVWREWPGPVAAAGRPPLLLLHGGFGSWTHWARNLPGLMEQRTVWTLDLPGLGDSADMPPPFTSEHFAEVILGSLDRVLGEESTFELAGFSFGGMLGAHVSLLGKDRCDKLVLIGAAGCGELHHQVSLLTPPDATSPTTRAKAVHRENLARLMIADPANIDELAVYIHADNLARHRFRSRKLAGSNDLLRILPDIRAKLVGIWGEQDPTAGGAADLDRRRELFKSAQPHCAFHVLPGIGHWAMYEAPEHVNQLLLD